MTTPKDERTWKERLEDNYINAEDIVTGWALDPEETKYFIDRLLHAHQAALTEEMVKEMEKEISIIRRHLTPDNPQEV